jgi:L-histidine N-alpha-methyltransferase
MAEASDISSGTDVDESSVAKRIATTIEQVRSLDGPLGFGLWEMRTAARIGEVMGAIKGTGGKPKHIKDGYQYVGGFPAHMWRLATNDDHYKTLSYGIETFHRRWGPIRQELTMPFHYVSIGPGTGEKDQTILRHLQSLLDGQTIVYVPVDISPELLRYALDVSMREIDQQQVEVLPIELDITNEDALDGLRAVIDAIRGETPVLLSLLGNTLANFHDDVDMLRRIASLLSDPSDLFFLELATTGDANDQTAAQAASEYEGSLSFNQFAMATLREYTNLHLGLGKVVPTAEVEDGVISITTRFSAAKRLTVESKDGDTFVLEKGEDIELYKSRKYTAEALKELLSELTRRANTRSGYSGKAGGGTGFGIAMQLLSQELPPEEPPPANDNQFRPHPAAKE